VIATIAHVTTGVPLLLPAPARSRSRTAAAAGWPDRTPSPAPPPQLCDLPKREPRVLMFSARDCRTLRYPVKIGVVAALPRSWESRISAGALVVGNGTMYPPAGQQGDDAAHPPGS
jgi:hypothetical protein